MFLISMGKRGYVGVPFPDIYLRCVMGLDAMI